MNGARVQIFEYYTVILCNLQLQLNLLFRTILLLRYYFVLYKMDLNLKRKKKGKCVISKAII